MNTPMEFPMLTAHPDSPLAPLPLAEGVASDDYDRVRRAIAFISKQWRRQPSIEEVAGHLGLSVSHLHHLFRRWAGITPKAFLQAVTLDRARDLLRDSASILDAASVLSPSPNRRSNRIRGFTSIGFGVVGLLHETVFVYAQL